MGSTTSSALQRDHLAPERLGSVPVLGALSSRRRGCGAESSGLRLRGETRNTARAGTTGDEQLRRLLAAANPAEDRRPPAPGGTAYRPGASLPCPGALRPAHRLPRAVRSARLCAPLQASAQQYATAPKEVRTAKRQTVSVM